jgi:lipoprotein-releasing system ATP-binding protein
MSEAPASGIRARNVVREFDDGQQVIRVLRGLELSVREGESVAIVGESGVGKSTLLHILGALDRPDAGEVELDGEALFALSGAELARVRCRSIGFVFQFHHLLGDFNAEENVMLPLLIADRPRAAARKAARETLERVGLGNRLHHRPGMLSGGEQQRVAVARAIVGSPRLLLADEPTGNLDPGTAGEVQALLLDLQRERRCAMVVATHSSALAQAMDRTLRLADGVLHAEVA